MLSRSLRSDARRSQKEDPKRQIVSSTAPVRRWEKMTIIVPENGMQVHKWVPLNEMAQPISAPNFSADGEPISRAGGQKVAAPRPKTSRQQYQLGNAHNAPRNILDAFSSIGVMQPGENMTAINPLRFGKQDESEADADEPAGKLPRMDAPTDSVNDFSINKDESFTQNEDSLLNNDADETENREESESDDPNATIDDSNALRDEND